MINVEIEKVLDTLSELCCDTLAGNGQALAERKTALLRDLLECGFARTYQQPLQVELENRVRDRWHEPILVHRDELQSLTAELQHEFNAIKHEEVTLPGQNEPPAAANLSTAAYATRHRDLHS